MKGGQFSVGAASSALGSSHSGASLPGERREANPCSLGWRGPPLWASGVSESRPWGGGRSHYLDACGRLGRRDERARKALRCISRSLVSAPAVHHRASRWRRPAAGWRWLEPHWLSDRRRREPWESSTVGRKKKVIRGVKIIRAQKYAGVDNCSWFRLCG